jgi:ABC-type uncharacterized transport system permease subunit
MSEASVRIIFSFLAHLAADAAKGEGSRVPDVLLISWNAPPSLFQIVPYLTTTIVNIYTNT